MTDPAWEGGLIERSTKRYLGCSEVRAMIRNAHRRVRALLPTKLSSEEHIPATHSAIVSSWVTNQRCARDPLATPNMVIVKRIRDEQKGLQPPLYGRQTSP